MFPLITFLTLLPLVFAHLNHGPSSQSRYEVGTITFPLTLPFTDTLSPEPRPRELMLTVNYPLLAPLTASEITTYPLSPYFPPKTARLTETQYLLPSGFFDTLFTSARLSLPFVSSSNKQTLKKKYRVVGYIPGYGGLRLFGQNLTQHLTAQYGYITLTTESPYEATVVEYPTGRVANSAFAWFDPSNTTLSGEEMEALAERLVNARVADWRYILKVLDSEKILGQLPGCEGKRLKTCRALVETKKVGMFGHSLGGATLGDMASREEFRHTLSGVVNMDGLFLARTASKGLKLPFLLMQADREAVEVWWPAVKEKARKAKIPFGELEQKGTEHGSFTDLPGILIQAGLDRLMPKEMLDVLIGKGEAGRQNEVLRTYLGAFFAWVFGREHKERRRQLGLLAGDSPKFPEVKWKETRWN